MPTEDETSLRADPIGDVEDLLRDAGEKIDEAYELLDEEDEFRTDLNAASSIVGIVADTVGERESA